MKLKILISILSSFVILSLMSCEENETQNLSISIAGLEDLGSAAIYEGWLLVEGIPVSTGKFTVDAEGTLSETTFIAEVEDLDAATAFLVTVESVPDLSPSPSDIKLLAGDFLGNYSSLSIAHRSAIGHEFEESAGSYILATPTDMDDSNEKSGVWFVDNSSGFPEVGLDLPDLSEGWVYEGWALLNGVPVSTGTFTETTGPDASSRFSEAGGPPFPGEEFLLNAPDGYEFPINLAGQSIMISMEPVPDNSPKPFVLKPLLGEIPADAEVNTVLEINRNRSFPTGTATR